MFFVSARSFSGYFLPVCVMHGGQNRDLPLWWVMQRSKGMLQELPVPQHEEKRSFLRAAIPSPEQLGWQWSGRVREMSEFLADQCRVGGKSLLQIRTMSRLLFP